MTEEDKKLISTFEARLRHLMFLYNQLEQENDQLKQQLVNKNAELAKMKTEQQELEVQYTNLKMARTIRLFDKDIKDTKQRLNSLVREVDKCIALLNQ
jgi:predicted  nucleic acid-binding Zn-ribbon protein